MVYKSIEKVVCLAAIYIQFITSIAHCHKHGAPNKSCKTLLPHHKHITYHETSAEIKTFIIDGNNIDIEIQSEKPFKGFILQVRNTENKIVGQFMEGKNYKLMTCDRKYGNSITHFNSHHKHKVSSKWQSDSALTDTLIIHAVVVFDRELANAVQGITT